MPWARSLQRVLVPIFLLAVAVQFFLAGLGVFTAQHDFGVHITLGYAITALALVLMVIALAGRSAIPPSVVLFVLTVLQIVLIQVGSQIGPWVMALHPLNGAIIFGVAGGGIMGSLREQDQAPPAAPAAPAS